MSRSAISALAALAISLPVATPAAAAGNPLSSIFKCESSGKKQEGGAVIGGVVGGLVGSKVAKNDTVGAVVGAAVGAAAGSYIGCRMQRSDQKKAERAAQEALDRNRDTRWSNSATGTSGETRLISTLPNGEPVSLSGLRMASGVELQPSYDGASGRYTAPRTANLRGGPSTSSPIVGKLQPGEGIDALARVRGSNWLLAGRDGVAIGYVSETVVRPSGATASGPVCRTFDQTIQTRDGSPETQRYTACKGADGQWVVQA